MTNGGTLCLSDQLFFQFLLVMPVDAETIDCSLKPNSHRTDRQSRVGYRLNIIDSDSYLFPNFDSSNVK